MLYERIHESIIRKTALFGASPPEHKRGFPWKALASFSKMYGIKCVHQHAAASWYIASISTKASSFFPSSDQSNQNAEHVEGGILHLGTAGAELHKAGRSILKAKTLLASTLFSPRHNISLLHQ
jgi:hypothetical protein